jgi:hypothetical protein
MIAGLQNSERWCSAVVSAQTALMFCTFEKSQDLTVANRRFVEL